MQAFIHGMGERFTDRFHDPEAMMAAFERHNAAVRAEVAPERLLEWTAADGWDPICERLGLPVPDEPFPVTNTTERLPRACSACRPSRAERTGERGRRSRVGLEP